MHHAVIDSWSRRTSPLHSRDARVKLLVLLAFLTAVSTTTRMNGAAAAGYGSLVMVAALAARLPLTGLLARAAAVLPFAAVFGAASALAGDWPRAADLAVRSYLSAAAVLVLVGTTPLPALLRGLEAVKAPRFLLLVVQFLYRYLFVISEQAQHMKLAAACRAPAARRMGRGSQRLRAAAGAIAVLFARSYARAERIHRAMLARGFSGRIELLSPQALSPADVAFLAIGFAACLASRLLPAMVG